MNKEIIDTLKALSARADRSGNKDISIECLTMVDYYLSVSNDSRKEYTEDQRQHLLSETTRIHFQTSFTKKEILEWFEKKARNLKEKIKKDCEYYYLKEITDTAAYGSITGQAGIMKIDCCHQNGACSCKECPDYKTKK